MKKYLAFTALALMPVLAQAQQVADRRDATQGVLRVENNYGGRLCNTATVTSFTVPVGISYIRFDPPSPNFQVCLENSATAICGASTPSTTTSLGNGWSKNPIERRVTYNNYNGTTAKADVMYVVNDSATGCTYWHWNAPMTNE
ncbi:hypothetical protein [Rhizobium leguminosarum]|nr:hypothetical protein [Rhizobium leguminosarum]